VPGASRPRVRPGYPLPSGRPARRAAGSDFGLRNDPAAMAFGLLHPAKFVLLNLKPAPAEPVGFADRLTVVYTELTGDNPEWTGAGAMLIRPDGYIARSSDNETPPLASWLGQPK
jgi:hypothetical protein